MSDDTTRRGSPDNQRINMNQEHEVEYWTHRLGVSRDELQRAVDSVGPMATAVAALLGGREREPHNAHERPMR